MNTLAQTITTPLTSKGSKTLRTVTGSLQSCNTHTEQIWILVIHRWPIHTDSTPLPNPPNRLCLNPPTLSASHGHTWSLLTKLHPSLLRPDRGLGCPGCSRLISKLFLITADCVHTSSASAAGSTQHRKVEEETNKHTNKKQGHWQVNHLEKQIIWQLLAWFAPLMQQPSLSGLSRQTSLGQGLYPHFLYTESSNSKHNIEVVQACGRENTWKESTGL